MRTCPRCDAVTAPEARFCASCGNPLDADGPDGGGQGTAVAEATQVMEAVDRLGGDDPTDPSIPVVDVSTVSPPSLTGCPSCGAPNAVQRRVCGRCGEPLAERPAAVLDPTAVMPAAAAGQRSASTARVVGAPARGSGEPTAQLPVAGTAAPRRRWIGPAVVVAGLLAGGALGGLAVAGVGPFARRPALTVTYDAVVYGDPTGLDPARAGASSSAVDGDAAFVRLADSDVTTAWTSASGDEVGALVELRFGEPVWVTDVRLAVGDQASDGTFAATARPAQVILRFDGDRPVRISLSDARGFQEVRLDVPRLTETVQIEVEAVTGVTGNGLSISEMVLLGSVANSADAEAWRATYG